METWMVVLLIVIADLAIGIKFAVPQYVKKLDELEQKLQRARPDERLEFPFWKELGWNLAVFVFWWAIFPYEWLTDWRQWKYPFCAPEWKEMPKNARMQFLQ